MKETILFKIRGGRDNIEIRKVLERTDGVKYVIVPKNSKIKGNDYVKLIKLEEQ